MDQKRVVIIGKLGKPHGIKGWLKLQSFTEPKKNIFQYQPWLIEHQGKWETVKLTASELHGKGFIIELAEIKTPEQAKLYTNLNIGVYRDRLPTLAESDYYWSDLEGLTVQDEQGKVLGIVDHLMETGSNDVLIVKGQREIAIPYIKPQVIREINLAKKLIIVAWDPDF